MPLDLDLFKRSDLTFVQMFLAVVVEFKGAGAVDDDLVYFIFLCNIPMRWEK